MYVLFLKIGLNTVFDNEGRKLLVVRCQNTEIHNKHWLKNSTSLINNYAF